MRAMEDDVKQVVLDFMHARAVAPLPAGEEEALDTAYLDEGLLDSMAVVELVTTLEEEFGFRLQVEDMQSPEFRTVRGLIAIASRSRAASA